jgi:hypothetical protein
MRMLVQICQTLDRVPQEVRAASVDTQPLVKGTIAKLSFSSALLIDPWQRRGRWDQHCVVLGCEGSTMPPFQHCRGSRS